MNITSIESQFAAMGARFRARVRGKAPDRYELDIQRDRQGAFFELRVPERLRHQLDVGILQTRPRDRHLLLLVRREEASDQLDRFLCGHDEREWFVAAVPDRVSTVAGAMESLKPEAVHAAQALAGLSARERKSRKNRAFRRQGEWFFIPTSDLNPDRSLIHRNEPIRRGGGKPHFVEELVRQGGTKVYVCQHRPNGVTEQEFRQLIREDPKRSAWNWRPMQRDAAVFARGAIRHPDHQTITLPCWHQVLMNTENRSTAREYLAFLD